MLTIRLTRVGRKNQYRYRLVLTEHTWPVKGRFLEILGSYNPEQKPSKVQINKKRVEYWLSKGAKTSHTVADLLKKEGIKEKIEYRKKRTISKKKKKEGEASKKEKELPKEKAESKEAPKIKEKPGEKTPKEEDKES